MIKLTVFFEDPFWVGIFERMDSAAIQVSKVVFGQEPRDYQVYEFILKNFYNLKFTRELATEKSSEKRLNPKKMKKLIEAQLREKGVGTKAQQAMKLAQESKKIERKIKLKETRENEKAFKFKLKQEKKKQKKRGN